VRWLQTDAARFRLVGVINRLDRRDFNAAKGEGGCGEVRFIYRLAYSFNYDKGTLASRMPFNFNAVFTAAPDADGACTGVAGRWTPAARRKRRCRLAGRRCARQGRADILKQLELNAQVTRFPSGQEPGSAGRRPT
jgi:hypothetical protein